jgi:hypothetical protein
MGVNQRRALRHPRRRKVVDLAVSQQVNRAIPVHHVVRAFDFLSDGTGVALAGNNLLTLELYATPDGGKSWTWIDPGDVKPVRVKLLGPGRAWLWDSISRGYESADGLRTWQRIQCRVSRHP